MQLVGDGGDGFPVEEVHGEHLALSVCQLLVDGLGKISQKPFHAQVVVLPLLPLP